MQIANQSAPNVWPNRFRAAAVLVALAGVTGLSCADDDPVWDLTPGQPGMNDRINVLYAADAVSPTGPALIAGGAFTTAGGADIAAVARWDGSEWQPIGGELPIAEVLAIEVFQSDLFVSGIVGLPALVRWDGATWTAINDAPISWLGGLGVFDAGNGPELYISGGFVFEASDGWADYIVRWDGTTWYTAGDLASVVNRFLGWDDGTGSALYGAGLMGIQLDGGGFCVGVGRWDGAEWSRLGGCVNGVTSALAVFDDGSGEALYYGGAFTLAGDELARGVARWDGSAWSPLGDGVDGEVLALAVFDDGSGPALYVGGEFTEAGGTPAQNIARWDGSAWSAIGNGANGAVRALTVLGEDAGGPALAVAGDFTMIDGEPASRAALLRAKSPEVPGDIDGDGAVNVQDLLLLLAAWGTADPDADLDGSGAVDVQDLLLLLSFWS
jgi:hypothetical protein